MTDELRATTVGSVTLVGGGPGADDLLTVAATDALAAADVVFFDRLAPHRTLAQRAPKAELVDVGKRPGYHALSQREIEAAIVARALAGERVVRLKGGDPYVFGRGGEEVLACHAAGVPVTVIPGVTSAVAVPASAGIPLTHRGVSRLFTVVSGHVPLTEAELEGLAKLGGTIVILMGIGTLPHTVHGLQRWGVSMELPVAIIERGFSDSRKTTVSTLGSILADAARAGVDSPAVIVLGEVVRLAHDGEASAEELMARAELFATLE
ncbi:uroporphyrinogen-III C-methyltransferase [Galbitalea soli]|uniref:uroporphyrinogen-III C-methyltransferase n=1 Tax=Galbitalea soli TaxID=1268042 RepID=A0A7C9PM43_9MICO|nr:uroporphyrinogen-III C-methyltransferase [Galbitalea soli]NYJ31408.1 uroporphyrin-III C-methyltransferase [Galbitalea soli]